MVIDDLSRLRYRSVQVNADEDLACKDYVHAIIDTTIDESTAETSLSKASNDEADEDESLNSDEIEEFERLLDQFIRESMEDDDEDTPSDDDDDDDLLSDDDEIDLDDFPEGSVHTADDDADDTLFPSGEIEQNLNLSVKVEILRPIANPREELDIESFVRKARIATAHRVFFVILVVRPWTNL